MLNGMLNGTKFIIDLVFPARCIQCGKHVYAANTLCSQCWQQIPFFFPPWCKKCGLPLRHAGGHADNHADGSENEQLCLSCMRYQKPFHTARSVLGYVDNSHRLILQMKNGDSLHASQALSSWMARITKATIEGLPSHLQKNHSQTIPVIPVPISPRKLRQHRYYPTAKLARLTAKKLGTPYVFAPDILERVHDSSQRGKKVLERIHTVRHAYRVPSSAIPTLVQSPLVILIDDVMTTGATVSICSQKLQEAGAKYVIVTTAARVPQILPRYPRWLSPPLRVAQ